ncbi:MAG TPA: polysaccharide biosynthesis tyrosine autokinase [Solirubrobacteraceae bacterium]|nr:polysaccharide biosynthesis tyrosine autokinase [Solirubrobacteraceae bacterium]
MSSPERPSSPLPTGFADQPVDAQRYLGALRRGIRLIAAIMIVVTVAVLAISLELPKTYRASVDIVYNPAATLLQSSEATSTQRQLATFEALVQTPPVATAAAYKLSESPKAVKDAISASADPNANLLTITASARKGSVAAARANAVAQAFLSEEQSMQNLGLDNARAQLQAQIARLQGTPGAANQVAALEARISALQINAAGTASELQIAESAAPPSSPSSPRVALNAIVAIFASLLIGVLVVLGRDQLRPRFTTPRELGQTLSLPVLAGVPYRRRTLRAQRRRGLSGLEHETYDALQATIRLLGPANGGQNVLLVTSATHGEGKTTVAASLARSLSRAGQKTLVISGDLRSPTLHEHFGLRSRPGFSDCLLAVDNDAEDLREALDTAVRAAPGELNLDVLNAGQVPPDPAALLSSSAVDRFFEVLRQTDYSYVLIDSPPILGLGDAQFLARQSDDVLVAARLDRVSPGQAEDLRDLLKRLQLNPIGVVVMGARVELSPYYLAERPLTRAAS